MFLSLLLEVGIHTDNRVVHIFMDGENLCRTLVPFCKSEKLKCEIMRLHAEPCPLSGQCAEASPAGGA